MLRKRLSKLSIKNLLVLSGVFVLKPFLILPTLKATKKTLAICNELFGDKHHGNTRSNAFRHALWNYLICEYCRTKLNWVERAVRWSKKITDLHEDLAPNGELAKAMDLHNNLIGRKFFAENSGLQQNATEQLRVMMKKAIKIFAVKDIISAENELVYIED